MTLHRYAVIVSIVLVVVIGIGGSVTTLAEFAATAPAQTASIQSIPTAAVHAAGGVLATLLVLIAALWVAFSRQRRAVQITAWAGAALAAISSALGMSDQASASVTVAIVHACLAPVILSLMVSLVVLTAPADSSSEEPLLLPGGGKLRIAALAGPPLALIQIIFGALYRHKAIGVLLHMGGALVVSLLTLIVCVAIMQQITHSIPLRNAAVVAMIVVLTQLSLGIAAFVMRLLDADTGTLFLAATVLHVTVGSMTLASTALLAIYARGIRPAKDDQKIAFGESQ